MKKVLAFFGAFNPPTNAHLALAEKAMQAANLKEVVFVPSKSEYIVDGQGKGYAFEDEFRMEMLNDLKLARPWMTTCDYDIKSEKQPRTYETLCRLREDGVDPVLLIGSDVLTKLETDWQNVDKIAREFGIVCVARDETDYKAFAQQDPFLSKIADYVLFVQPGNDYYAVSSTKVRRVYNQSLDFWKEVCASIPSEVAASLLKNFIEEVLA